MRRSFAPLLFAAIAMGATSGISGSPFRSSYRRKRDDDEQAPFDPYKQAREDKVAAEREQERIEKAEARRDRKAKLRAENIEKATKGKTK